MYYAGDYDDMMVTYSNGTWTYIIHKYGYMKNFKMLGCPTRTK